MNRGAPVMTREPDYRDDALDDETSERRTRVVQADGHGLRLDKLLVAMATPFQNLPDARADDQAV